MTGTRMLFHVSWQLVALLWLQPDGLQAQSTESCLGPGFTETIPPQEELSQYSATVLKPGDRAIYTTLSFRCNGTLESLTIPSQLRGSDYSRVDDQLESRPSIWRFNDGYKFISENDQRQMVPGATDGNFRNLNDGEVLSFNFTVMLQMDIQAGDVLGFWLVELGAGGRIEHLPLLYKPGPTPGSFTPIVIANFTATSDTTPTEPSDVLSPSSPSDTQSGAQTSSGGSDASVAALAVLFALALLVIIALIVAVVVLVVMLKRKQTFSVTANNNDYYNQTAPLAGRGLDTEANTTILGRDRSGNSAELGPVRPGNRPLYEPVGLGGSIGEHVEMQPSPAYQAASMPDYI